MEPWFETRKDPKHAARERARARELKNTRWWREQLARGVCHYCGKRVLPEHLTLDHVVPVARGGKSTRGNCVPCCRECNRGKSLHTPAEILLDRIRREKDEKAPGAPAPEKDGDP